MRDDDFAIRVEHLSKVYRLGTQGPAYGTLRDAVVGLATAPVRRFRRIFRLSRFGDRAAARGPVLGEDNIEGEDLLWALRDVTFQVKPGEVMGVIGRNGAGKSTLLKILARITRPTAGRAFVRGRVGSLLEVGTGFHPELTGRENIYLNAAVLGMSRREIKEKFDRIVDFAETRRFLDTPVKRYSSGMKVRLAFAVAAHIEPEILIVDEVLAVGDFAFQQKCLGKMGDVTKRGRTVLFVSHNMSAVSQLTERCMVLDRGRVTFLGPTDEAIHHYIHAQEKPTSVGRSPMETLVCEKYIRNDPRLRFVELGLAADQDLEIFADGEVRVEALLDSKGEFENVCFGYTVTDEFGGAVITGWSPPFRLPGPGRHLRELRIRDLRLAPGTYALSVSIQSGAMEESKYVYECVLRFGRFAVKPFFADGRPVGEWKPGWGRVIHTHSDVSEKD